MSGQVEWYQTSWRTCVLGTPTKIIAALKVKRYRVPYTYWGPGENGDLKQFNTTIEYHY